MKLIKRWLQLDPNNSDALTSQDIPYILNDTTTIYDKLSSIETSQNNYVLKSGDTMTGDLTFQYSGKGIKLYNGNGAVITNSTTNLYGVKFYYGTNSIEFVLNTTSYVDIRSQYNSYKFDGIIRLDDYSSQQYYGFWTSGNKLDSSDGLIISSGNILLGSTKRITGTPGIELSGSTSSALLSVQDGNGRIQLKWNATRETSETFLVGGEHAGMWEFDPATLTDIFTVKFGDGSTAAAGDTISWQTLFQVGTTSILYKGNTIWHAGNDGTGSGLDADKTDGYHIWVGTQAEYDALGTYDTNTLYFING